MRILELELQHFRNYSGQRVSFDPDCNVIFGENAQGKTNLLEAIVYLSCGNPPGQDGPGDDCLRCARRCAGSRDLRPRPGVPYSGGAVPGPAAEDVGESGACQKQRRFESGVPHCILLPGRPVSDPGGAARRRFMDTALCQLRPRYAAALAEYHRLYDHKTRILRDSEERPDLLELLPDFNERMVRFGAVLVHYRRQFAEALNRYAARHHRECSGGRERLEITYQTVSSVTDPAAEVEVLTEQLRAHMESHQGAERASRMCLSGPHKDDLVITIDGREAKFYSSQGQTRTAALALKLAEREIYQNATGEYPVLLLDDVLSELDPRRQEFVLNRIAGGQVFITCCEDDRLPVLLGGKVFHVKQGAIG